MSPLPYFVVYLEVLQRHLEDVNKFSTKKLYFSMIPTLIPPLQSRESRQWSFDAVSWLFGLTLNGIALKSKYEILITELRFV